MDSTRDGPVQAAVQNSRDLLAQVQVAIGSPEAQRADTMIRVWHDLQTMATCRLIPELNQLLETLETQSSDPALETQALESQLRSLNPEVTRLIKLLQIDWQFLQAARQADRISQRQQQLLKHLQQLDQLLEAIGHHLNLDQIL